MLLTDVQPYDSDVLHLSISTKTYCWCQLLSNGGNLFVHPIKKIVSAEMRFYSQLSFLKYLPSKDGFDFTESINCKGLRVCMKGKVWCIPSNTTLQEMGREF